MKNKIGLGEIDLIYFLKPVAKSYYAIKRHNPLATFPTGRAPLRG
jgi:hypothetical protein